MSDQRGQRTAETNAGGSSLEAQLLRVSVATRLFGAAATPVRLGRYLLHRRIGEGGMGVVFEASEGRTGQRFALKVLRRRRPEDVALLKREFRALADLHHPNLVQRFELSFEDDVPFLAMELIQGMSLSEFVRRSGELDGARLWSAASQLVDAISTLHAAGVLHRDVKPSNLLVEPSGRLVVLDFGLALVPGEPRTGLAVDPAPQYIAGTLRYMAPERLRGQPASEASDWYGVGLVLRDALVGVQAEAASDLAVPKEPESAHGLARLCRRLLEADPARRPRGDELRAWFGLPARPRAASPMRPIGSSRFVGREAELQRLDDAFRRAVAGRCVQVHVCGEPGIGKTALARHCIAALAAQHELTVLAGRCYEGELIPFNAVDGFITALGHELQRLSEAERPEVAGAAELLRLFPSLAAVLPAGAAAALPPQADPYALRRGAFAALRSLVCALAARRPLLVHLDDLQWGDADSAQLLEALLAPPAPAPLLVLAGFRTGVGALSPCVRALRELEGYDPESSRLHLGSLSSSAALELARSLALPTASDEELRALSAEADGNPLFLRALVEYAKQLGSRQSTARGTGFHDLVQSALAQLAPESRGLLELAALAGRPVEQELLLRAAARGDAPSEWPGQLASLRRLGLLAAVPGRSSALEPYHDRLRESVVAGIAPAHRAHYHGRLAAAAAAVADPDPEFLAHHYEGAGELTEAARWAEAAADRAFAAAALEPAVKLYEAALRCLGGLHPPELVAKLARAVACSGRCAAAAELYLEAASGRGGQEALQLRLEAAEMLLRSGRVDEASRVAEPVLRAVGVRLPKSTLGALAQVFLAMQRLRRRGLHALSPRRTPSAVEHLRTEVCFRFGYRLGVAEPLRACALLARATVCALEHGSDAQVARALACHALLLSVLSKASNEEQDRLLDRAFEIADRIDDADTRGWVLFLAAVTSYSRGLFREAQCRIDRARDYISAHCVDAGWLMQELDMGELGQLMLTGQFARLASVAPAAARRCRESGSDMMAAWIEAEATMVSLAGDRPEDALRVLDHTLARWRSDRVCQPEPVALWIKAQVLLYCGDTAAAWAFVREHWPRFARAGLLKNAQPWCVGLPLLEATVALSCARGARARPYLRAIRGAIAHLREQRATWAGPARLLVEAGWLHLSGAGEQAARKYAEAAQGFEALSMLGYASAARVRQAELVAEREAAPLRAQAAAWFRAERIAHPERWLRMYAPIGGAAEQVRRRDTA